MEVFESHPLRVHNGQGFYDPELTYASKKEQNQVTPSMEEKTTNFSKTKVYKNVIVLGVGSLLLFTAYKCLVNLQSSINHTLGTTSLSAAYLSESLCSLFLSSFVINVLGLKRTLTVSFSLYVLYILANFDAEWYTLGPASVLAGMASSSLWTAQGAYLTIISGHFSQQVNLPLEACLGRIQGDFYLLYLTSQIWGNLISDYVLEPEDGLTDLNKTSDISMCGPAFCNSWTNDSNLELKPTRRQLYMLYGIYTSCVILATLLILFMLDPLANIVDSENNAENQSSFLKSLTTTLKHTINPYQLLMIPLTLYTGLEEAFIAGDFTKAFVSCGWGVHQVGYVMVYYGLSDSIFSFVVGRMMKLLGRVVIFIFGMTSNVLMICLMLWWHPPWNNHTLYFVIAGLCGFSDAIWHTLVNAIYGLLFFDAKVPAFANLRLWKAVGFMIAFSYSSFLCTTVKIALLMGFLTVGMGAYLAIEIHLHLTTTKRSNVPQLSEPSQKNNQINNIAN